jgi:Eco57I restriction-modification methylase
MTMECVRSEGALIPADILAAIAEGQAAGQKPQDFGLPKSVRLTDEIAAAWSDARAFWAAFQHALRRVPETDPATTQTRELWVQPLLGVLGYEQLTYMRAAALVEGQSYAVSHRAGSTEETPPIHIAGCRTDLDTRPPSGRPRLSPHALIQEYLNRTEHLWGIVTNGHSIRLLRNSVRTSRPTYVEFDLQQIMEAEKFAEFALCYRLLHRTRLPQGVDDGPKCLLEAYHQQAIEAGGRVRDGLRYGVEEALKILGGGFLAHPANDELRAAVSGGSLKPGDYYAQLLRLVYRLLFLMVSEERKLVAPVDPKRGEAYRKHYGVTRLRVLAERRTSGAERYGDLWLGLLTTFRLFEDDSLAARAGIAPLNGDLFGSGAMPSLEKTHLTNQDLLHAVWHLSTYTEDKTRRRVNYAALDVEELGSVYESLLDYHPQIDKGGDRVTFNLVPGSERKTTGSYYTPPELVQELIRHALDPVIEARLKEARSPKDQQIALRSLTVCDPACGSGHFLLAAARRIGRELARVRTGEDEPTPAEFRLAVREVIQHCIYGVDRNPLAVDLCKLALWLEGHWTGKPLTFLDHRIKCGDSLVGILDPAVLEAGIPDEAFAAVADDDSKEVATIIRRRNRAEREGQQRLPYAVPPQTRLAKVAQGVLVYLSIPEETPADVRRKADLYRKARENEDWWRSWTSANLWTAAFLAPLSNMEDPTIPTHDRFRDYYERGVADGRLVGRANGVASHRRFFHWKLEFPEVFGNGGFDVVLGNPPWDTLSPDAKEFFAAYDPQVRFHDRDGQQRIMERLLENPVIAQSWADHCRWLYSQVHFFKDSGRYSMFAPGNLGKGDFNVYRMFIEAAIRITREGGRVAQIVPEGLYNGANCMAIRKEMIEGNSLEALLGFENAAGAWFPGVHRSQKFCVYSLRRMGRTTVLRAAFNIRSPEELRRATSGRALSLPAKLISEFSPEALAILELSDQRDIDIAQKLYAHWPKFGDESAGEPIRRYMREIDMGNDRELFSEDPSGLPLYEGRMVDQFDYRAKGYRSGRGRVAVWEDLPFASAGKSIQSQWRILAGRIPDKARERTKRYRISFCNVGSPTNERTMIGTLIPPGCICGDSAPTITFKTEFEWAYMIWLSVANSFSMDFLARKKVALHLTHTLVDSLPFPRLAIDDKRVPRIAELALRLCCTGPEMIAYWNSVAPHGWVDPVPDDHIPPCLTDEEQRLEARAELDVIVARDLFGLTRDEMEYILGTFPIVERKEREKYGSFRSRELILQAIG